VDVRFQTGQEHDFFLERLEETTEKGLIPGTGVQVEPTSQRPAMSQSQGNLKLYQVLTQVAAGLGQELGHEFRQGVSDANLIAAQGTPVVDGLGPLGGKDHSDQEFLVTKSLAPRAALLTLSLLECFHLCQAGVFTSPLRRAAL
jgi:glutamate carboxypeptidase